MQGPGVCPTLRCLASGAPSGGLDRDLAGLCIQDRRNRQGQNPSGLICSHRPTSLRRMVWSRCASQAMEGGRRVGPWRLVIGSKLTSGVCLRSPAGWGALRRSRSGSRELFMRKDHHSRRVWRGSQAAGAGGADAGGRGRGGRRCAPGGALPCHAPRCGDRGPPARSLPAATGAGGAARPSAPPPCRGDRRGPDIDKAPVAREPRAA